MTIKTNQVGFTTANLITHNHAQLLAEFDGSGCFQVDTEKPCEGWAFTEESCREAAEFFTQLANELRRRRDEDLSIHSNDEIPF